MKVLEFAFDSRDTGGGYLPHCYTPHCVVYTGTHDNDTIQGWMKNAPPADAALARAYLRLSEQEGFHWGMMRSAWASAAELAVMQFPYSGRPGMLPIRGVCRQSLKASKFYFYCIRAPAGRIGGGHFTGASHDARPNTCFQD